MFWSFLDAYFAVYIAFAVCTVLLYIKGPLKLDQKATYFYFFLIFLISSLLVMLWEFPSLTTDLKIYPAFVFNKAFFDFCTLVFFFLTLGVLLFSSGILQAQKFKEEFYILLYFFIFGSYFLFKVNDLGILYLVIELPRACRLCISSKL
jgi:NADH:ubiquinone oxidoreductase subunit 2 (subunit N)